MTTLLAATLNIRNIADRWPERLPLLLADMAGLQPDVIGLQEVVFAVEQDRFLGASGAARYETFRDWAGLRAATRDPTLYPSDHVGLAAQLRIGE